MTPFCHCHMPKSQSVGNSLLYIHKSGTASEAKSGVLRRNVCMLPSLDNGVLAQFGATSD